MTHRSRRRSSEGSGSGNVGVTSNKATIRSVTPPSSTGTTAVDTSVGTHTVHVKAVDRVGLVTEKDLSYSNDQFGGFKAPVDNPPIINVANAGSSVPVKFSLGVNLGLSIFVPGTRSSSRRRATPPLPRT
jgi:hypothetical protein